jgi:DNA invertase Pin-like site-specific DNA recombinase
MESTHEGRPKAYSYVRMSTDAQLKGHSRQRQIEKSVNYAATHKLDLADETQLEDIGVSAYRGANVTGGALGQFLEAVENGRVPKGSYLIVESLDRISRQEILDSLDLFLRIIRSGINLVTLEDEKVYNARTTDYGNLNISLGVMARAHEESLRKGQRVAAAWSNKRSLAGTHPMTKMCPAWLRLNDRRTHYEKIPEKVQIVQRIFQDTAAGIGSYVITKRLNQEAVPGIGRAKSWQRSYVAKILTNRAVIGEYQPCKISTAGKREPDGPPIKNYFPTIIEEDLFYRAQKGRSDRRIHGRGRKGQHLTNLFSGMAKCAYCRRSMVFENKGPPPKGGTFLVCAGAKGGLGCSTTGWRYDHFETSFLALVEQLDLRELITKENSKKRELQDKIQALEGEKLALRTKMEKLVELLEFNSSSKFVGEKLAELEKRETDVDATIKETETLMLSVETEENEFRQSKEEVKSLIARLQTPGDDDLYKLRSQVAARIKGLIDTLQVATAGTAPKVAKATQFLEAVEEDSTFKAQVMDHMKIGMDKRYFAVGFKSGDVLIVYPRKDDPWSFERRVQPRKSELFLDYNESPFETEIGSTTGIEAADG